MKKLLVLFLLAATAAAGPVAQEGLVASKIVSASYCRVTMIGGYNSKASAQFIQFHNSATLPAEGAVPVITFTVPASSNFSYVFPDGWVFDRGLTVCNSSTATTKTIGSADISVYAYTK